MHGDDAGRVHGSQLVARCRHELHTEPLRADRGLLRSFRHVLDNTTGVVRGSQHVAGRGYDLFAEQPLPATERCVLFPGGRLHSHHAGWVRASESLDGCGNSLQSKSLRGADPRCLLHHRVKLHVETPGRLPVSVLLAGFRHRVRS
jgi:hypothetical protein